MIRVGATGRIVSGDDQGQFVRVEEDPSGFIVITSPKREFKHGEIDEGVFDNWVASRADLAWLWDHRGWVVEWLD